MKWKKAGDVGEKKKSFNLKNLGMFSINVNSPLFLLLKSYFYLLIVINSCLYLFQIFVVVCCLVSFVRWAAIYICYINTINKLLRWASNSCCRITI